MREKGKYIYGIIYSNTKEPPTEPIDILATTDEMTDSKEIYIIPYQDIAAIVSDCEEFKFSKPLPKDILVQLLVKHQKVIESIMNMGYTVIPMRLGTLVKDETEVKGVLNKGYQLAKEIIQKLTDKIEMDVVCVWSDFAAIIKEAGENSEIKELRKKFQTNSQGITIDDQMEVGFRVKNILDRMREDYANKIKNVLQTISQDFKQPELMDEKIVTNAGFLIDKGKQNEFYEKVEALNDQFAGKINFKCVGPLPPYSFYTLEISKIQFKDVDWAKNRLGIVGNSVSRDSIRDAYRKAAFTAHPDQNPGGPEIKREFEELKKSYNILLDYCQTCEQTGRDEISFSKEEIEGNSFLVKVKENDQTGT